MPIEPPHACTPEEGRRGEPELRRARAREPAERVTEAIDQHVVN
jgi:hypothetical protein